MFKHEFDQIIREHFDLSDKYTRKYIASLKEDAQQDQLLAALSSALYNKVVEKVDDIDFGTIPLSRGDITKVQGFTSTEECLNIIRRLVIQYKQNPAVVDVVISAVNNIKERKALFIKGYALNAELPMLMYNTMVLAIERSTSLMIATCIEYVKDATADGTFKMALDKAAYGRTMDDLLFKQLIDFNNLCHKGQLDKTLESVMRNPVKVKEEVETMYGSIRPIDEEDPTKPEAPTTSYASPFADDDTVEPFDNRQEDMPSELPTPFADEPAEPPVDPAENQGPEERDINPDTELTLQDVEKDEVEPENIPTVNPGDDVFSSETPINELEDQDDSDETNNGVPYIPEMEEPVEEGILGTAVNTIDAIGGVVKFAVTLPFNIIMLAVKLIRSCVYYYYYSKMKISDYLEIQADLIEANANDLQYSTTSGLSDKEKEKVVKKQLKMAGKLRKWSNKFSIDSKSASNQAKKQSDSDDKNKNRIGQNDNGDDSIF